MYCYVVKSPVFSLQRGSAKSPIAPSNFSSLWLKVLGTFLFSFLGCKTIKGADPNALCIFPFRFRGKTHDTCIGTNNQAWCSTKVDNLGNHVRGKSKWGYCGQGCPFPEIENGKLFSNFSATPNCLESFVI